MIYDMADPDYLKKHKAMNVYVDDELVRYVVYVDTEKGIVRHHGEKPKFDDETMSYEVIEKTGVVRVEPIEPIFHHQV